MTLNPQQQAAVDSKAALKVVIAGPGSGKSRVIIECARSVPHGSRVALMTYTQAGAAVFRQRLAKFEGTLLEAQPLTHCGTLHSYCYRLINRFGGFLGYIPGKVGILPDAERIPRLLACRDKLGLKVSQKAILDPGFRDEPLNLIWKEYEFLLKRNNLVDYDGILRVALELFNFHEVQHAIKLDYLFVDESQDSAVIDWNIYTAIPATNKVYVGDPDQSIFAFRGAFPAGLVSATSISNVEVHKLELNYRSDKAICQHANVLIRNNKERVDKWIEPISKEMGCVEVEGFEEVGQELVYLAGRISGRNLASAKLGESESIAVLYRMNHDVKMCRDYLRSMGIPIQEPKFEQRPADWERAKLLLGLMQSPDNEILAERYLSLDFEPSIVKEFRLQAAAIGKSLLFTALPWTQFNSFANWPQSLAQKGVSESTVRLIQEHAQELSPDADISDLLHALHSNEEPKEAPDGGIYCGTIHSFKGKEADVIFAPGFEQGIIPSEKDLASPEALEEARRLAFVLVSRARHELYISHCAHRRGPWGPVGLGQPSQFIAEMGLS